MLSASSPCNEPCHREYLFYSLNLYFLIYYFCICYCLSLFFIFLFLSFCFSANTFSVMYELAIHLMEATIEDLKEERDS